MKSTTTHSPPLTLEDYTESMTHISEGCPSKDKFDYVYLKTSLVEKGCGVYETKHYPLSDFLIPSETFTEEEYEALFTHKLQSIKKVHVVNLEHNMQDYIEKNQGKRGTVYFSPASKFSFLNTPAKELYVFGFKSPDGKLEIQSESNFIII